MSITIQNDKGNLIAKLDSENKQLKAGAITIQELRTLARRIADRWNANYPNINARVVETND